MMRPPRAPAAAGAHPCLHLHLLLAITALLRSPSAFAFAFAPAASFPRAAEPCHSPSPSCTRLRAFSSPSPVPTPSPSPPAKWTMAEDWALIDAVRAYTVFPTTAPPPPPDTSADAVGGGLRYTLWERAVRSEAALMGRTSQEARSRYEKLLRSEKEEGRNDDGGGKILSGGGEVDIADLNEAEGQVGPGVPSEGREGLLGRRRQRLTDPGPSPLVLNAWWIRYDGMCGSLEDGREVWFPIASLGRFPGQGGSEGPSGGIAVSGGYAEAVGGAVYELGIPRLDEDVAMAGAGAASEEGGIGSSIMAFLIGKDGDSTQPILARTATSTLSALGAVCLLSAAVGLGAGMGMGIRGEPSKPTPAAQQQYVGAPVRRQSTSAAAAQTVSEMRARQELRIIREKKVIRAIEGRLGGDEARLDELRRAEKDPTAQYDGETKAEMRARQEVRILQEKREIKAIEGILGKDQGRLDELQRMERDELR